MKKLKPMKSTVISFILYLILVLAGAAVVEAWYYSSSGMGRRGYCSPSLIQFTGTVYAPDEKPATDLGSDVFDLVIDSEKTWVFVIDQARNRSCTETKLGILKDLYPRKLHLRGAEDQLAFLQRRDLAGESVTIQGYLYRDSRRLDVTNAETMASE